MCFAQPAELANLDTARLQRQMRAAKADTERVKILYLFAESYCNKNLKWNDLDKAREYTEQGLALAKTINYRYGVVRGWVILADFYGRQSRFDKAAEYAFMAQAEIKQVFPVKDYLEFLNGVLSFLYYKSGKYQEVVNIEMEVLRTIAARNVQSKGVFILAHFNIGNSYTELGQLDSARKYFGVVLKFFLADQDHAALATTYTNLGEVEMIAKNFALAKTYFDEGIRQAQSVNAHSIAADALSNLAQYYLITNDNASALSTAHRALKEAKAAQDRSEILDAYSALQNSYAALGDFKNAYVYDKLFYTLKDSLSKDIFAYQVENNRQNHLLQQHEAELKMITQDNRLRITYIVVGAIGLILLLSTLFFVNRLAARRRTNLQLLRSKNQVETALDKLQRTQQQLIAAEKLASLGKLVANLAHELNSPLGAIKGSADYLHKEMEYLEHGLQQFWRTLNTTEQQLFEQVLEEGRGNMPFDMSTREERQVRKKLQDQVALVDATRQQETADALFQAGIWDAGPFYPHLTQPAFKNILAHAAHVQGIRNSVSNVLLSIERTNKVIVALRLFQKDKIDRPRSLISVRMSLQKCLEAFRNVFRHQLRLFADLGSEDEPDLLVLGYADELLQLWVQLISNAVQSVGTEGEVIIKLASEGSLVTVHVTDTGGGVAAQELPYLFEPFLTTQEVGRGAGLGLFVAKKISEKHGGNISVQSEPGRTTFTVTLPLAVAEEPMPELSPT